MGSHAGVSSCWSRWYSDLLCLGHSSQAHKDLALTWRCSICASTDFRLYGEAHALFSSARVCEHCHSHNRHRQVHAELLKSQALVGGGTCLHLAPEHSLRPLLEQAYGSGYRAMDADPLRYACQKLVLPQDFALLADMSFDLIVHNHVLEHIPGHYVEHLKEFWRILRPGGQMLFTIPDISIGTGQAQTIQGGEFLASDQLRLQHHGQEDHYKTFGRDLFLWLNRIYSRVRIIGDISVRRLGPPRDPDLLVFCVYRDH